MTSVPPAQFERAVSVVIPTKAGWSTIERAIASMLPEAACVREVIVVTSNSAEDYRTYCEKQLAVRDWPFPVRVIDSGNGSNGAIARNVGIEAACGTYLAFLDDDDEAFPDRFQNIFRRVQPLDPADSWVAISRVVHCQPDRSDQRLFPSDDYQGEPIAEFILRFGGGAQTNGLFLPTHLAKATRFDPGLIRHQDYDFCLRLEEAGARFVFVADVVAYWYATGNATKKGGTFDFCTRWVEANRHRLSDKAVRGYVEKELFAAARAERKYVDFVFQTFNQLSGFGAISVASRILWRALAKFS